MSNDQVLAHVMRWAALLWEEIQAAGASQQLAPQLLVAGLCSIHKESRGLPEQVNEESGAWSLTQQVPRWYSKRWSPRGDMRQHLRIWAQDFLGYLRQTGGYLPTANLCWASGARAVEVWIKTGDVREVVKGKEKVYSWVPTHLAYVDHLYDRLWPIYSAAASGWLAAGQPYRPGQLVVDGFTNAIPLASEAAPAAPMPSPYDGWHRIHGDKRVYDPSQPPVPGAKPPTIAQATAPAMAVYGTNGGGGVLPWLVGAALLVGGFVFKEQLLEVAA